MTSASESPPYDSTPGRGRQGRRGTWLWPALAFFFAVLPVVFWMGQAFDEEIPDAFSRNWSDKSFLEKVLDTRGWDFYQGRELSIAIDVVDQQWLRWWLRRDVVWFVAPSAVLASLAYVAIGLTLVPRAFPSLTPRARWLSLLLLLGGFVHQSTIGLLNRATKPLVAPLLLALLLLAVAEHRRPRLSAAGAFATSFGLGLAISLLDRQGLFYVMVLALVLALAGAVRRRGVALLLGTAAAVGAWQIYFRLLGPPLIHSICDYWPSMRFQRVRLRPLLSLDPWLQGLDLLGDWTSLLFGGTPKPLLVAVVLAAAAAWAWHERRRPVRVALAAAAALAAIAAQLTMVAMMVERHAPVTWPGSRLWNYPLPYQALLTFGVLWLAERLLVSRPARERWLAAALGTVVIANVARWPELRTVMDSDPPFHEQFRRSQEFVRSFRNGWAEPSLDGPQRRVFFECLASFPRLAARARLQVSEGSGVATTEIRSGRLAASAEKEASLVAWTRQPGRYVVSGAARLRAGETVTVLTGGSSPRMLAVVGPAGQQSGLAPFRVPVDLGAGATPIRLVSSLDEAPPGSPAAYELELPFALLPAPPSF